MSKRLGTRKVIPDTTQDFLSKLDMDAVTPQQLAQMAPAQIASMIEGQENFAG